MKEKEKKWMDGTKGEKKKEKKKRMSMQEVNEMKK